jgi:hypothetical protein
MEADDSALAYYLIDETASDSRRRSTSASGGHGGVSMGLGGPAPRSSMGGGGDGTGIDGARRGADSFARRRKPAVYVPGAAAGGPVTLASADGAPRPGVPFTTVEPGAAYMAALTRPDTAAEDEHAGWRSHMRELWVGVRQRGALELTVQRGWVKRELAVVAAAALSATTGACIKSAYGPVSQAYYTTFYLLAIGMAASIPGRLLDWAVFTAFDAAAALHRHVAFVYFYASAFRHVLGHLVWAIAALSAQQAVVQADPDTLGLQQRFLLVCMGVIVAVGCRRLLMRVLLSETLKASFGHRLEAALLHEYIGCALTAPHAWAEGE